jgi:hypothetical protein
MGPRFRGDDERRLRKQGDRWRRAPAGPAIPGALRVELGSFLRFFWKMFEIKGFQPVKTVSRGQRRKLVSFRHFFMMPLKLKRF